EARGIDGVCAGKPTPGLRVKLLTPTRDNIVLDDRGFRAHEVDVGEIVVAGAHVCAGYWQNDDAFARAKICDRDGVIWHRTGDVSDNDVRSACASCGVPVDDIAYLAELPMDARHHSKVEVDRLRAMLVDPSTRSRRTAA